MTRCVARKPFDTPALYTVVHRLAADGRDALCAVSVDLGDARHTKVGRITVDGVTARESLMKTARDR